MGVRFLKQKVEFANAYLNNLLKATGRVYTTDIYSVVTRDTRESGEVKFIDMDELKKLTKEDRNVQFVRIKEAT